LPSIDTFNLKAYNQDYYNLYFQAPVSLPKRLSEAINRLKYFLQKKMLKKANNFAYKIAFSGLRDTTPN
jgi:hypothetical protein